MTHKKLELPSIFDSNPFTTSDALEFDCLPKIKIQKNSWVNISSKPGNN